MKREDESEIVSDYFTLWSLWSLYS